jgi:hypothetical protein
MLPREELFLRILLLFAVITGIVGVINLASSGSITIGDVGGVVSGGSYAAIPGQMAITQNVKPYIEGANTASGILVAGIDFTAIPLIDTNTTKLSSGFWELTPGVGLVLTAAPFLGTTETVLIRNIQSVGNVYTVNYLIDNSQAGGDWHIYPRSYGSLLSGYDIDLNFKSDGIHIPDVWVPINLLTGTPDLFFYPMPGASNTIAGGSTIQTVLTEIPGSSGALGQPTTSTSILTVSKDGTVLFTTNVISAKPGTVSNDDLLHGGVGSNFAHFILVGIPTTPILSTQDTIISSGGGTAPTDPLTAIGQFWDLISTAMGLGNQSIIPAWLAAIVILPPLAVLILIGVEILRGV